MRIRNLMQGLSRKPVLVAMTAFIIVWVITASVAYAATVYNRSLNAAVNIMSTANFSFYSNQTATTAVSQVSLPDVSPGGTSSFTVYVKNTSTASETLTSGVHTVPASVGTLILTFDGATQKTLAAGAVSRVVGTLTVASNAPAGPVSFAFSVNAAPLTGTTTTTTTTTTPPATTVALNGQQIFNSNCTSCHGLPNTNLSQSQLVNFIPGHRTGSSLTSAQVAAVAAYIQP